MEFQTVESGDRFRDNDPRLPGERVIQVRNAGITRDGDVEVVTVEHWNERRIGRHTWVSLTRLQLGAGNPRGYTKVGE